MTKGKVEEKIRLSPRQKAALEYLFACEVDTLYYRFNLKKIAKKIYKPFEQPPEKRVRFQQDNFYQRLYLVLERGNKNKNYGGTIPTLNIIACYFNYKTWEDLAIYLENLDIEGHKAANRLTQTQEEPQLKSTTISDTAEKIISKEENQKVKFAGEGLSKEAFPHEKIKFLSNEYWDNCIVSDKKKQKLEIYYTDFHRSRIPEVVANEFLIPFPDNYAFDVEIDRQNEQMLLSEIIASVKDHDIALIKIVSKSGAAGKSTFLYYLAFKYKNAFDFYFLQDQDINNADLKYFLNLIDPTDKPIVIIIDDASKYVELNALFNEAEDAWFDRELKVIFLIADWENKLLNIKGHFERILTVKLKWEIDRKKLLFEKLIEYLDSKNGLSQEEINRYRTAFLSEKYNNIGEAVHALKISLRKGGLKNIKFDWDYWDEYVKNAPQNQKELQYIFVAVACFNYFGLALPISFVTEFFEVDELLLTEACKKTDAIKIEANSLTLSHDQISLWLFKDINQKTTAEAFFLTFSRKIKGEEHARMIRKLGKSLRKSNTTANPLLKLLDETQAYRLIENYLAEHQNIPTRHKLEIELAQYYLKFDDKRQEGLEILENHVKEHNPHATSVLASYYTSQNDFQKAWCLYDRLEESKDSKIFAIYGKILIESKALKARYELEGSSSLDSLIKRSGEEFAALRVVQLIDLFYILGLNDRSDVAENILNKLENKKIKAKCYFTLAKSLPYRSYELKHKYFIEAKKANPSNMRFGLEHSVFLFRICDFKKSTTIKNALKRSYPLQIASIEQEIQNKIDSLSGLYFKEIETANDDSKMRTLLQLKLKECAPVFGKTINDNVRISQTFLKAKTVLGFARLKKQFHDIYFEAQKTIAALYSKKSYLPGSNKLSSSAYPFEEAEKIYALLNERHSISDFQLNKDRLNNLMKMGQYDGVITLAQKYIDLHPLSKVGYYKFMKKAKRALKEE